MTAELAAEIAGASDGYTTSEPEVAPPREAKTGFRSYEVYQRMRVRETTPLIKPRQLSSTAYLTDPFSLVGILRENYPCYRDWPGNAFWVTQYNDVTSVFVDDANFESRTRRWRMGLQDLARDLTHEPAVRSWVTTFADDHSESIASGLVAEMAALRSNGSIPDLAIEICARFPIRLLCRALGLGGTVEDRFARAYFTMQRGAGFEPRARDEARAAIDDLRELLRAPMTEATGLAGVVIKLGGTIDDLIATLIEGDHQTLHGGLANMWSLLLTHPDQLNDVRREPRLLKQAWAETLRHSPPVLSADRFTRHEVERFGRLLPAGALIRCSAAAANRDPRIFDDADTFDLLRKDLCQREPRGTYRADGLASGISFGTGRPSQHPAMPENLPRSAYALTRDTAITVSRVLLDELPGLHLPEGAAPTRRLLRLGEVYTCWSLPVTW
jgi:cytochrome P450